MNAHKKWNIHGKSMTKKIEEQRQLVNEKNLLEKKELKDRENEHLMEQYYSGESDPQSVLGFMYNDPMVTVLERKMEEKKAAPFIIDRQSNKTQISTESHQQTTAMYENTSNTQSAEKKNAELKPPDIAENSNIKVKSYKNTNISTKLDPMGEEIDKNFLKEVLNSKHKTGVDKIKSGKSRSMNNDYKKKSGHRNNTQLRDNRI